MTPAPPVIEPPPPPSLQDEIERVLLAAMNDLRCDAHSAHPHMLRHSCGYALANAGHDTRSLQAYLGHKNIQHTMRYTELAPDRFKNFWR